MRGKKVDKQFLSDYIEKCISEGKYSSEQILCFAKGEILKIDEKIAEAEKLKKLRIKLIDVISTFDDLEKNEKDKLILNFIDINRDIAKNICEPIKKYQIENFHYLNHIFSFNDIDLTIKKLIYKNIIKKENYYIKSDNFELYCNFIGV